MSVRCVLRVDQLVGDKAGDTRVGDVTVWSLGARQRFRNLVWPMAVLKQDRDEDTGVLNLKLQG